MTKRVLISGDIFHNDQLIASLAIWAYVVPSDAMRHAVFLGHNSRVSFTQHSYSVLPPRLPGNHILGDLNLSHTNPSGASAIVKDALTTGNFIKLRFTGNSDLTTRG